MDRECPLCGCQMLRPARIACDECQSEHLVCQTCAEQLTNEGYQLVA